MTALREKTVILVTHQVEFLSEVDTILVKHLIWVPMFFFLYYISKYTIIMKILGNGGWKSYSIRKL